MNTSAVAKQIETLPLAPVPEVAASPMLALLSDAIQKGMSIDVIREIKSPQMPVSTHPLSADQGSSPLC